MRMIDVYAGTRWIAAVVAGLALAACGASTSTPTTGGSTPTPTPSATISNCRSSQLTFTFVGAQGAAGTILDTFRIANNSGSTCTIAGYVGLRVLDSNGKYLLSNVIQGGGPIASEPGVSTLTLPPGATSIFDIAWSDVPTGAETTCPSAAILEITPPGDATPFRLPVSGFSLAPCNGGTIYVYPVKPAQ